MPLNCPALSCVVVSTSSDGQDVSSYLGNLHLHSLRFAASTFFKRLSGRGILMDLSRNHGFTYKHDCDTEIATLSRHAVSLIVFEEIKADHDQVTNEPFRSF